MKDWVFGRRFMEEQPGGEGENGGGAGGAGGGEQQAHDNKEGGTGEGTGAGEEEHNNALGEELNKPDAGGEQQAHDNKTGDQGGATAAKPEDAPTEEEKKAYAEAIKLDEEAFGKGAKIDDRYMAHLPGLFKKHGIAPDKANSLANDFVKMQKDVEKDTTAKIAKFREWRQGEMKKMNDAYLKEYDQAGRGDIARAITHFFPKGSPMYQAVCMTEVGVDPGFLKAMKFIGERLPKDAAPGAAAGAGSGGTKSISDSFMGL